MRKHQYKKDQKYNVEYRPLTVMELSDGDFIRKDLGLFRHQKDYLRLNALIDSIGNSEFSLQINCEKCSEKVPFMLYRSAIQVEEYQQKTYQSNGVGITVSPYKTGKEEIHELIATVVIDGDILSWEECTDKEKSEILEAIDYETYKSILTDLEAPTVAAHVPIRCSCGYESVVSLRGLQAFLEVI